MNAPIDTTSQILFGDWTIEPNRNRIERAGKSRTLEPRLMDILLFLCSNHGKVVSRNELLAAVWPDLIVTEDALNKAVSEIRKAFSDDSTNPQIIETIRKRGYRFIPSIKVYPAAPAQVPTESEFSQALPMPASMRSFSIHFHWPSALLSALAVSLVWFVGIMTLDRPVKKELKEIIWVSDGMTDSSRFFIPHSDSLDMILFKDRSTIVR